MSDGQGGGIGFRNDGTRRVYPGCFSTPAVRAKRSQEKHKSQWPQCRHGSSGAVSERLSETRSITAGTFHPRVQAAAVRQPNGSLVLRCEGDICVTFYMKSKRGSRKGDTYIYHRIGPLIFRNVRRSRYSSPLIPPLDPAPRRRPLAENAMRRSRLAPPQAAPLPKFALLNQPGPQGVSHHVPRHRGKMSIVLHRKALICALIKMPAPVAVTMPMPAANVRRRQPMHERGQLAVLPRPQQHMPVIGHQSIG